MALIFKFAFKEKKINHHLPLMLIGFLGFLTMFTEQWVTNEDELILAEVSHRDLQKPAKFNIWMYSLLFAGFRGKWWPFTCFCCVAELRTPHLLLFPAISLNTCINKCFTHTFTQALLLQKSLKWKLKLSGLRNGVWHCWKLPASD